MRLNPVVDIHINAFSGAGVNELESGIRNGIVKTKTVNGQPVPYVTQRPAIDIFEDADTHISDARGRAVHFWDTDSALWIFNNDTLYKDTQAASVSSAPTAGTKKCMFLELGTTLILLDAENNEAWTISTSDAVAVIPDADFPATLAYGGAVLNNVLYVLSDTGIVYGSDDGDATSWNALAFLGATRENDGGVCLAKHFDSLVILGPSTIEFFYDAGNPSGLALSRRQDVSYNTGCSDGETVWEAGDRIFFVGVTGPGALQVYSIETFALRKISTPTLDSFISQAIVKDGFTAMGSGFSANGRHFYVLTIYTTPADKVPDVTFVWDDTAGLWYEWYTDTNDITKFPIAGWTKREGTTQRYGEGILSNGDLISINDNLIPVDTLNASIYVVETGGLYMQAGYIVNTGANGALIEFKVRFGMVDGGTTKWKYPESYRFVGNATPNSQTLTLKWSNEKSDSFNTGKTTDTSKYQKITRTGRFRRRNHEVVYTGLDQLRIEAIEADFLVGDN